jgi:hypothetical protein
VGEIGQLLGRALHMDVERLLDWAVRVPSVSVAVQVTRLSPIANVDPDGGEQSTETVARLSPLAVAVNVTVAPLGLVAFTV